MAINSTGSINTANRIESANNSQEKSLERIASGKQINRASDDPAGLSISTALESQARSLFKQISNRQDEISLMQTAEGGMNGIADSLQRIRELSVQSANGTLTDSDRGAIQMEIDQLKEDINQNANNTEFNTKKLLDGTLNVSLQNGNSLAIKNMSSAGLGISNVNASTILGAESALSTTSGAIDTVSTERSSLGAISNGVTSEMQSLNQQLTDTLSAGSRIADADIAREVVNLTLAKIKAQASVDVFRIQDSLRGNMLNLLKGI